MIPLSQRNGTGLFTKIPCEYGEIRRAMWERIKEHKRLKFSGSEHTNGTGHVPVWEQVKFIDHD